MIVIKFGGTSVSSKENIQQIKGILDQKKNNYVMVVSAFSGMTNHLETLAQKALEGVGVSQLIDEFRECHFSRVKEMLPISIQTEALLDVQQHCNDLEAICNGVQLLKELSPRTKAIIFSFGERLSSRIIHRYLISQNMDIELLDSRELIVANGDYLNGEVDLEQTSKNIAANLSTGKYLASGFIASNSKGEIVTLGRGGSDYSASIYASALDAEMLEIWSDINGIHNANPKHVKNTKAIHKLSYEEAFELAYFGAKVLYPPSVLPVMKKKIPVYLKNTLRPEQEGTLITSGSLPNDDKIQGLSSLNDIAILTVSGVGLAKQKGRARKVFQTLEESEVNVILITQSCSEQSIGIGISQKDLSVAESSLNLAFKREIDRGIMNKVRVIKDQCIIALVGDNMKHRVGLCGKVFGAIGENGINVTAIAQGASERNLSIVIDQKEETKALNIIHEKFFNNAVKNVHLFIAGIGNVGGELLNIIDGQREQLIKEHRINLKIVGVANSKRFLMNEEGIQLNDLKEIQEKGNRYDEFSTFLEKVSALNLRNSVFVDNTASEIVSQGYSYLLKKSISVITCNKIACSGDFEQYKRLNELAKEYNCYFKYETSVGAALPIIKTIHDLNISGDRIHKIEAVISGSLNFIFNEYDAEKNFSDVVLKAKEEGYTEPNPLIDLSGLDVMRKILILTREAGFTKELEDISFESFLPDDCANANSNDDLFQELTKYEDYFEAIRHKAQEKKNKLKVIASMENGEMTVSLKEVSADSPFYNLEGKDNVVAINTDRYAQEPLVIKGAGAGASVTASGVFADLMFTVNR